MAYAHVENQGDVIVSKKIATEPEELADFVIGTMLLLQEESMTEVTAGGGHRHLTEEEGIAKGAFEPSPLIASRSALDMLKRTVVLVEEHVRTIQSQSKAQAEEHTHLSTPKIMERYNTVTGGKRSKDSSNGSGSSSLIGGQETGVGGVGHAHYGSRQTLLRSQGKEGGMSMGKDLQLSPMPVANSKSGGNSSKDTSADVRYNNLV
jgi:hypothetical protein